MPAEERLAAYLLGPLPEAPTPAGAYAQVAVAGGLAFVSGQLPVSGGRLRYAGPVGAENASEGREAARLCAINVLAQLRAELGSLDRVARIARLSGYVSSERGFAGQPAVMDGASDIVAAAFGPRTHARVAIGVASLPLDAMVEVDAVAELAAP